MTSQREKHVRITPRLSETLEQEMLKLMGWKLSKVGSVSSPEAMLLKWRCG